MQLDIRWQRVWNKQRNQNRNFWDICIICNTNKCLCSSSNKQWIYILFFVTVQLSFTYKYFFYFFSLTAVYRPQSALKAIFISVQFFPCVWRFAEFLTVNKLNKTRQLNANELWAEVRWKESLHCEKAKKKEKNRFKINTSRMQEKDVITFKERGELNYFIYLHL